MLARLFTALFLCLAVGYPLIAQQADGPALIILDVTEDSRLIKFDEPLETDDPAISGRSLAELAEGRPLFAPIEGLPAAVWEDRQCSGCHNWNRETLCEQGQFYLGEAGKSGLAKIHPYGGGFKQELLIWSSQGCN